MPASGYTEITTITSSLINEFIHENVDPVAQNNYYFIRTDIDAGEPVYSDTLQAIKLRLIPLTNNSIARLDWNAVHTPSLPSSEGIYRLFRKYSYASWTMIYETDDLFLFVDTIKVCYDSINYRVEVENILGCASISNVSGNWLQDLTQPPVPLMDSVSTDFNGNALLSWQASGDSGTTGYIIYRNLAGFWNPIDTVFGLENVTYTDIGADACTRTRSYQIAAIDSCGNKSARGIGPENLNDSLRTLLLHEISYDPCNNTSILSWTPYINMMPELSGYKIYVSIDNSPFEILTEVSSSENTYVHQDPDLNTNYSYYIQAYNAGITSTSCIKTNFTYYPDTPQFLYMRTVSVWNNHNIKLIIYADSGVNVMGYNILRSEDFTGPYISIDTLISNPAAMLYYDDLEADFNQYSYYYKAEVLDSCGRADIISNPGRSILLTVESPDLQSNVLSWNEYEQWDGPVEQYDIYRKDGATGFPDFLGSTSPGITTYADNITGLSSSEGNFVYFVEAIEGSGITYDFHDTSRSNEAVARQESNVMVPNAIAPKGTNNIFKPVFRFFEQNNYNMRIFNKWGELIFESNNPEDGWNGKHKGTYVPMGAYAYKITYKDSSNKTVEKFGTVIVIY